ncbi:YheC/YheD family protein [Bacillus sp. FJAT-49736]|uniref:YheC/YheD family endospore coat-associated protein n=1 Tax=Bacillus sp. FJAT-49736 TaxID=2833582 RepID=UPI001BCA209A|nr:YheC/YheD family protein [Bacillus sp. FJAT-49736]MBS4171878.1 YheC/YheD family protein [Bacillus sp. FJAT-49736]
MTLQISIQKSNPFDGDKPIIQVPLCISEQLNITVDDTIQVKVGRKIVTAELIISQDENNILHMNQRLYQELFLPLEIIHLQAYYHENRLCLGPVIAVLTEIRPHKNQPPSFGSIHNYCGELHHYSQKTGAVVYITSLSKYPNKGFFCMENGWAETKMPHPDFIYNRIHSRKNENSKLFKKAITEYKEDNTIFFNSCFVSKWEVHEQLEKVSQLQAFLPKTSLFDPILFPVWMNQHKDLFLKPVNGSQGHGIIHVFLENNVIFIERTNSPTPSKHPFKSVSLAAVSIQKWMMKKSYIMQETIPLITDENKKIDFRFLCHKINLHEWKITSAVARISGDDQFVSNIAQGGVLAKPLEILSNHFAREKAVLIYKLMKDLALEVSNIIGQSIDGFFAELGIDIGVDVKGNPWLIEVNSKPSKQIDSNEKQIRPSTKAIIHYCMNVWKERSHLDDNNGDINTHST